MGVDHQGVKIRLKPMLGNELQDDDRRKNRELRSKMANACQESDSVIVMAWDDDGNLFTEIIGKDPGEMIFNLEILKYNIMHNIDPTINSGEED